ncbi:hypothetical protein AB1Y20_019299 [Prymnesium parvum]|uniref:G-patch domain-containing protein n=1 Tax=Prymnesium parvum TaxID=97485 RepID=A0AB34JS38_PRYPA|eukprot:CAMPEP_0182819846 /NCGR_PEP_ID=MMETSP0006_2-20121128/12804_1 /TAXON_ID=97485 /ORGANISM="Prymnesium parvum, Strain Texoma1" /LENGTH=249 /DNA_ID=CAMNT_0024946463 /DNA_START=86 /DNA_END=835 /DNA_ORIENTATION=-
MTVVPLMTRKTANKLGSVLNEAVADTSMDFGRKMLAKFGWTEGKGLGRKEDGMKEHIRVKQRAENLGLGAQSEAELNAPCFAPPPELLKKRKKSKRKESSSEDSDSDSEDDAEARRNAKAASAGVIPGMSDEDLFKACGGARLGMRSRMPQGGKEKRMQAADDAFMAKFGLKVSSTTTPMASADALRAKKHKDAHSVSKPEESKLPCEADDQDKQRRAAKKAAKKEARKAARKAERRAAKKAAKQSLHA